MPIATTCPNCKALFRLPEELAGRKVRCQKCEVLFEVPKAEAETTVPGMPVQVEAEVIVAEKTQPRGPASSMPLPPMPIDPPAPSSSTPKPEPDDDDKYSDSRNKPPPPRKKRDEDDDRPTRPRRDEKPKSGYSTTAILLGVLGFGAIACFTCIAGTGAWFAFRVEGPRKPPAFMAKDATRKEFKDFAKKEMKNDGELPLQEMQFPAPPGPPIQAKLDQNGFLTINDQLVVTDPILFGNRHYKAYAITLEKGQRYQIDMSSNQLDSFLYILDETNRIHKEDDDRGRGVTGLDAQIVFVPPRTATYRILATTFNGDHIRVGPYTLTIQRFK